MDSLIETFHLDWKLMVAQVVNFAIVFVVLYLFALKPLKKLMDERGKTIAGGLENAKKQEHLLAKQEEDYKAAMAKASAEALAKVKESVRTAQEKGNEVIEKAQAEAVAIIAAGRKQADADREKMMSEIKKEAAGLIVSAVERVLGEAMDKKTEAKVVEESIKNI